MAEHVSHWIGRQVLNVACSAEADAFRLRSRLESLNERVFIPVLETVMDEFERSGQVVRLDRLEIDLGGFRESELETLAPQALAEALRRALRQRIGVLGDADGVEAPAVMRPRHETLAEMLTYYLSTGRLPNWAAEGAGFDPDALILELLAEQPGALSDILYRLGRHGSAVQRLVAQVSNTTLESLLRVLEPQHAAMILMVIVDVKSAHQRERLIAATDAALDDFLWITTLRFVLQDPGSQFNRKEFVRALLAGFAARDGFDFAVLLAQIRRTVATLSRRRPVRSSLPGILAEIAKEDRMLGPGGMSRSGDATERDPAKPARRSTRDGDRLPDIIAQENQELEHPSGPLGWENALEAGAPGGGGELHGKFADKDRRNAPAPDGAGKGSKPSAYDLLAAYLVDGLLPDARGGAAAHRPDALVAALLAESPGRLAELLRRLEPRVPVAAWLAAQLSEPHLRGVLRALAPKHAAAMRALVDEMSAVLASASPVPARLVLWHAALTAALADGDARFTAIGFVGSLLTAIARRDGEAFADLVARLQHGLAGQAGSRPITGALPALLAKLAAETVGPPGDAWDFGIAGGAHWPDADSGGQDRPDAPFDGPSKDPRHASEIVSDGWNPPDREPDFDPVSRNAGNGSDAARSFPELSGGTGRPSDAGWSEAQANPGFADASNDRNALNASRETDAAAAAAQPGRNVSGTETNRAAGRDDGFSGDAELSGDGRRSGRESGDARRSGDPGSARILGSGEPQTGRGDDPAHETGGLFAGLSTRERKALERMLRIAGKSERTRPLPAHRLNLYDVSVRLQLLLRLFVDARRLPEPALDRRVVGQLLAARTPLLKALARAPASQIRAGLALPRGKASDALMAAFLADLPVADAQAMIAALLPAASVSGSPLATAIRQFAAASASERTFHAALLASILANRDLDLAGIAALADKLPRRGGPRLKRRRQTGEVEDWSAETLLAALRSPLPADSGDGANPYGFSQLLKRLAEKYPASARLYLRNAGADLSQRFGRNGRLADANIETVVAALSPPRRRLIAGLYRIGRSGARSGSAAIFQAHTLQLAARLSSFAPAAVERLATYLQTVFGRVLSPDVVARVEDMLRGAAETGGLSGSEAALLGQALERYRKRAACAARPAGKPMQASAQAGDEDPFETLKTSQSGADRRAAARTILARRDRRRAAARLDERELCAIVLSAEPQRGKHLLAALEMMVSFLQQSGFAPSHRIFDRKAFWAFVLDFLAAKNPARWSPNGVAEAFLQHLVSSGGMTAAEIGQQVVAGAPWVRAARRGPAAVGGEAGTADMAGLLAHMAREAGRGAHDNTAILAAYFAASSPPPASGAAGATVDSMRSADENPAMRAANRKRPASGAPGEADIKGGAPDPADARRNSPPVGRARRADAPMAREQGSGPANRVEPPRPARADPPADAIDIRDPIFIANAGLILAGPFLGQLFKRLDIMKTLENGRTVPRDYDAASKGVHLLQFLVSGACDTPEPLLVLNKLLCGVDISAPVARRIAPSDADLGVCEELLATMLAHWQAISGTSVAGLRETFLQRDGRLEKRADRWQLTVDRKTLDVLTDRIPWGFSVVLYPWMGLPIHTVW